MNRENSTVSKTETSVSEGTHGRECERFTEMGTNQYPKLTISTYKGSYTPRVSHPITLSRTRHQSVEFPNHGGSLVGFVVMDYRKGQRLLRKLRRQTHTYTYTRTNTCESRILNNLRYKIFETVTVVLNLGPKGYARLRFVTVRLRSKPLLTSFSD